jgi:S-adenosylmethionine decarboxylase
MFNNKISAGKHLICDIKDIRNTTMLNSTSMLREMLKHICAVCEYQILNEMSHDFLPIGCSIIFLLSESHISIHTFPEKNYISFDLYSCRQYENNNEYEIIFNYLLTELDASNKSTCKIIDRYF